MDRADRRRLGQLIAIDVGEGRRGQAGALGDQQRAVVGGQVLKLLQGRPPRVLGYVIEWAALHQEEWLADWALVAANQPPNPIPPLR